MDPYGLTPERMVASVAAVIALSAVIVGGLALARARRVGTGNGFGGGIVAMMVGLIGVALGGLALTRARRTG